MPTFDCVMFFSCYLSPAHAIRAVKSIPVIEGNVLPVVVCPIQEDANAVMEGVKDRNLNVVVLKSQRSERFLCVDLGFIWCIANDIKGKYGMFGDDDIEFVSKDIIHILDGAPDFSVLGFSSSTTHYGLWPFKGRYESGDFFFYPCWIDGHNLFSKWSTNISYGIMDAVPGSFNSSFVEVEYAHRLSFLSQSPRIGCRHYGLHHHSRVNNVEQQRDAVNKQSVIHEGYKLWERKFGLSLSAGDFNSSKMGWDDVEAILSKPEYADHYKKHLILDGRWNDWTEITKSYQNMTSIVYMNYKKEQT